MDKLAVSISPSFKEVKLTEITGELIKAVESKWISDEPMILAADHYQLLSEVAQQFTLELYNCVINWKNFDAPCKVKVTQQGLVNILAPQIRNGELVHQATHLLAIWDGSNDQTKELIEEFQSNGKQVLIIEK